MPLYHTQGSKCKNVRQIQRKLTCSRIRKNQIAGSNHSSLYALYVECLFEMAALTQLWYKLTTELEVNFTIVLTHHSTGFDMCLFKCQNQNFGIVTYSKPPTLLR